MNGWGKSDAGNASLRDEAKDEARAIKDAAKKEAQAIREEARALKDEASQLKKQRERELEEAEKIKKSNLVKEEQLKGLQQKLDAQAEAQKVERERLAEDHAVLEKDRKEIEVARAQRKADFPEEQKQAFQPRLDACERLEKQLADERSVLDRERANLEESRKACDADRKRLSDWQQQLSARERDIENGLPGKLKELTDSLEIKKNQVAEEARCLGALKRDLKTKEKELKLLEDDLATRASKLIEAENQRDVGFLKEHARQAEELAQKERSAEEEIAKRRTEAAEETNSFLSQLRESEKQKISEELMQFRNQCLKAVDDEIAGKRAKFETEVSEWKRKVADERAKNDENKARLAELEESWKAKQISLEAERNALAAEQANLVDKRKKLDERSRMLDEDEQDRRRQFSEKVQEAAAIRVQVLRNELKQVSDDNKKLLNRIAVLSSTNDVVELLKKEGCEDPADLIRQRDELKQQVAEKSQLLAGIVDQRVQELESQLKETSEKLESRTTELEEWKKVCKVREQSWRESQALQDELAERTADRDFLKHKSDDLESELSRTYDELNRLRVGYGSKADMDDRIKEVRLSVLEFDPSSQEKTIPDDEISWLGNIEQKCGDYDIVFPQRILYAFHTALKTAEMSPLTVLAGVSGTGKSELPRLYSLFGGLFFEPVSVQPNWDSQESMLGYFNSIDNKFDAQRVLRFLAQSQEPWSPEYPGLGGHMCMVLLDEMNLAHPELYFAEFLSKFELRRGKDDGTVNLSVKLGTGAGMEYPLPLGRNVLWTGTMNQDETTKSLSDKVLDRSNVLFFPRPKNLRSRVSIENIQPEKWFLPEEQWRKWCEGRKLDDTDICPFKKMVERINSELGNVGRAVGHRVWQSIEAYLRVYPTVIAAKSSDKLRKALRTAFEDQLVQKIMPKLRGIDTKPNGRGGQCLQGIRNLLENGIEVENGQNRVSFDSLINDFDLASARENVQFIWQSADYIETSENK